MKTSRSAVFDNARGVLVVLVAVGHALEPLLESEPLARGLYDGIYLFHIPAFAALSGRLSRQRLDAAHVRSLFARIGAPLVIFQVLYIAFDVLVMGHPLSQEHLLQPYWILWFLLSLICWRLILPVLVWTRAPLLLAFAISLGAGAVSWIGYPFSLSRTCVFLPCFVAGYAFPREWFGKLRSRTGWVLALLAAAGLLAWIALVGSGTVAPLDTRWLYGAFSYAALGASPWQGAATRAGLLAISLVLSLALFALVSGRPGWLTGFGERSLAPFLLHAFFIRGLVRAGAFSLVHGPAGVLIAAECGALLALILGTEPVARLTRPLWAPLRPARRATAERPPPP